MILIYSLMSIIPKINIGYRSRKEHSNLSQDTHTTMEVGYLQPTFCRHIVPGSHTEIEIRNIVRLSAMNVPTMGRISLRNYIHFVDFSTLWSPFSSFKERVNYTYADGVTAIPAKIPFFTVSDMFRHMFHLTSASGNTYANIFQLQKGIVCTIYKNGTAVSGGDLAAALSLSRSHGTVPFLSRFWCQSNGNVYATSSISSSSVTVSGYTISSVVKQVITKSSSDFSFVFVNGNDKYQILGKFYGAVKRLRSIFIGCGYSFNPYDSEKVTFLKLLAVYKSYFDRFGLSRTTNFLNTNCYKFIKFTSENRFNDYNMYTQNGMYCSNFFADLSQICYSLPPDYFSVADTTEFRSTGNNAGASINRDFVLEDEFDVQSLINSKASSGVANPPRVSTEGTAGFVNSTAIKLAMRMLPYVNKQSVIGRKLADLLKADGIVDEHNDQHELTHKIGATRTDISIDDVMSFAGTDDNTLGDFAGRGIGSNGREKREKFYFDNKTYGCLLVLSCVVPVSGYFQGILKENSDGVGGPFDFFTSEFDSVGFQSVKINELVSDCQFQNASEQSVVGTDLGTWGLVPRYSHLKCGFNRCMGDISLPSTQDVMLPYTLDRHFLTKVLASGATDFSSINLPVNNPETFRRIQGADGYGDYNRIFQYVNGDYDHFITSFIFDVDCQSPMLSMRNSYDTFSEVDNNSYEHAHE